MSLEERYVYVSHVLRAGVCISFQGMSKLIRLFMWNANHDNKMHQFPSRQVNGANS